MSKKLLALALSAALALSFGTAAIAFAEESDEISDEYKDREIIDYWYPWGGDSEVWDAWRMDEFNKSQDKYYIRGQYVPDGSGVNNGKLLAAIQSGDVPDVIITDNTNGAYTLVAQGAFEGLDDALNESGFEWDRVNPGLAELMKYDDVTYLYPCNSDAVVLFVNNKMAEEAGLDISNPPKTIEELDEWADAMTKINDDGSVDCYGFIPWLDAGADVTPWLITFGAYLYDAEEDTYTVNCTETYEIFDWMRSYAQKFDTDILTGFTSNLGGAFSPDHAFFTGEVGMTVVGNWFNEALKEYAPDLEYTMVPVPAFTEDLYGGTPLTGNVACVPVGGDCIDGAVAWMNFIQDARIMDENNKVWLSLGIFPDTWEGLSRHQEDDPDEMLVEAVTSNPNSRCYCISPKTAEISDGLKQIVDLAVYTEDDIQAALDELNDNMNS